METFKHLAQHKRAGTLQQLAKKLNVSERTVERMLVRITEPAGKYLEISFWL
ncbi:MAG: HTH domain-containing protein [Segetibacter sp.]